VECSGLCETRGVSFGFQIRRTVNGLGAARDDSEECAGYAAQQLKLGANASAAAGPVGRDAQAATDVLLNAEFLTYSRAKGLFAGLDLSGDVLEANNDDVQAGCGPDVHSDAILQGAVQTPSNAAHFVHTVAKYFVISKNWKTMTPPKS